MPAKFRRFVTRTALQANCLCGQTFGKLRPDFRVIGKTRPFFPVQQKLSLASHALREESEREKRSEKHQENWTKTTSFIPKFTPSEKHRQALCVNIPDGLT